MVGTVRAGSAGTALRDVENERQRQIQKWGVQSHDPVYWCGILMEELGELAKVAIEDGSPKDMYEEATQVAAVAVAMMEDILHG